MTTLPARSAGPQRGEPGWARGHEPIPLLPGKGAGRGGLWLLACWDVASLGPLSLIQKTALILEDGLQNCREVQHVLQHGDVGPHRLQLCTGAESPVAEFDGT